jgi:hypothetical protein
MQPEYISEPQNPVKTGRLRGIDAFASKSTYPFTKAASGVSTDAAFAFSLQNQLEKCTR